MANTSVVAGGHPRGWSYAAATAGIVSSTVAITVKAAAGAGLRNYVASIQVQTATLGNATVLAIRNGASGAVLWQLSLIHI